MVWYRESLAAIGEAMVPLSCIFPLPSGQKGSRGATSVHCARFRSPSPDEQPPPFSVQIVQMLAIVVVVRSRRGEDAVLHAHVDCVGCGGDFFDGDGGDGFLFHGAGFQGCLLRGRVYGRLGGLGRGGGG